MFSPSQAVQKFFKIHHPMPLNAHESKQLLNLLTTSFRKNLDTAHEFRPKSESKTSSSAQHRSLPYQGQKRRRSSVDASVRPTDQHLDSILTNPLFNVIPKHSTASTKGKDPMVLFEQAAAMGMMNVNIAASCLAAKRSLIIKSPAISIRQGMRESEAGLKVLNWLVSSGTANNNDFLKDTRFAANLMMFMVAEELQETAWVWVSRAIRDFTKTKPSKEAAGLGKPTATKHDAALALDLLIRAEANASHKLDDAVYCLSRAADYLKGQDSFTMRQILNSSGLFLLNRVCRPDGQTQLISDSAFESLLGLLPVVFSDSLDCQMARMSLFHPSRPSARLAISFLHRSTWKDVAAPNINLADSPVLQLGLTTAKFLLEKQEFDEASWVLTMLQDKFPKLNKSITKEQVDQAKAEALSLHLLDSLSFA